MALLLRAFRDRGRPETDADVRQFMAGEWYGMVCELAECEGRPGVRLVRGRVVRD